MSRSSLRIDLGIDIAHATSNEATRKGDRRDRRLAPHTRVLDNHAEVVARRATISFADRFTESVEQTDELYALYDRLSR